MALRQEDIIDSTGIVKDTLQIHSAHNFSVFLNEKNIPSHNYPVSGDINRQLTPDWVLYFFLVFLVVLAWMRLIYSKFIVNIFKSALNYQLSLKIFNEPGIVKKRIFIFLNIYFYLSTGIFLYIISVYFEYHPMGFYGLKLMGIYTGFLFIYSLFRMAVMRITAGLFNRKRLFSEAIFHNFLYNKVTGIILTPVILLIAYMRGIYQDIAVILGLIALAAVSIIRIFRGFIFISKSVVLLFYFILYLCTLEILPVLVIIKLIFSLSKGP